MKKEDRVKVEGKFYSDCADLLGTECGYRDRIPGPKVDRETGQSYNPPTSGSRWGGREPGNGRFPPYGTIRLHWPSLVIIRLTKPKNIWANIQGRDEALEFLRKELGHE